MGRKVILLMKNQAGSVSRDLNNLSRHSLRVNLVPEFRDYGITKILKVYGRELFDCIDCLKVRALVNTIYSAVQKPNRLDEPLLVEMDVYIVLDVRAELTALVDYWERVEEDAIETFTALQWVVHRKYHKTGRARWLSECEKSCYAKQYWENGMIAKGEWLSLSNILETDRDTILGGRRNDGLFRGSTNMAWVLSDEEQQALLALEYERSLFKETQLQDLQPTVLLLQDGELESVQNRKCWARDCDFALKNSLSDAVSWTGIIGGLRRYGTLRML